jgi:SAM-dependent methyltransferase
MRGGGWYPRPTVRNRPAASLKSPNVPADPSEADAPSARRTEAWSRYWASGALHSCAGSFDGNYAGAIGHFWQRVFAGLDGRPARVLDLCCGNAPLSRLLVESPVFGSGGVEIDAVDAARVDPRWPDAMPAGARERLRVHGGIDATALPFADAGFDLCMSQYGIEYAGPAAFDEVARVLAPGGIFAGVLHHAQSLPVRIARAELAHLDWLERDSGLLPAASALAGYMALAGTPEGAGQLRADPAATAARQRFNDCMRRMGAKIEASQWPDVLQESRDAAMAALATARQAGAGAGAAAVEDIGRWLVETRLRQQEVVEAALDEARLRALLARIPAEECTIEAIGFTEGGELAGWSVLATAAR